MQIVYVLYRLMQAFGVFTFLMSSYLLFTVRTGDEIQSAGSASLISLLLLYYSSYLYSVFRIQYSDHPSESSEQVLRLNNGYEFTVDSQVTGKVWKYVELENVKRLILRYSVPTLFPIGLTVSHFDLLGDDLWAILIQYILIWLGFGFFLLVINRLMVSSQPYLTLSQADKEQLEISMEKSGNDILLSSTQSIMKKRLQGAVRFQIEKEALNTLEVCNPFEIVSRMNYPLTLVERIILRLNFFIQKSYSLVFFMTPSQYEYVNDSIRPRLEDIDQRIGDIISFSITGSNKLEELRRLRHMIVLWLKREDTPVSGNNTEED